MAFNRYRRKYRRARRGWRAGSRAIKLMDPAQRRALFGPTYMQRLADPELKEQTPQQRWMRRAMNYRGEGDYWSDIQGWGRKNIPEGTFSKFGSWAGGMMPGQWAEPARMVGALAGNALSKWVGFGDYGPPVTNQLMAGGSGVPAVATVNASDDLTGDIYMSHSEYVGTVNAKVTAVGVPTPFQQNQYALNPGLAQTFPFLSQIANNFEMYEFMGLAFQYRPLYGEGAGDSNLLGKVIMCTQYDPTADAFISSQQMQNYDYASSAKPSVAQLHGVETANKQQFGNLQYVRDVGNTTKSLIFTDIGFETIATEGIQPPTGAVAGTSFPVGELWVTYRVKLSRAKLITATPANPMIFDTWQFQKSGAGNAYTVLNTNENSLAMNDGVWSYNRLLSTNLALVFQNMAPLNGGRTFLVTAYVRTAAAKAMSLGAVPALGTVGTYPIANNCTVIGAFVDSTFTINNTGAGSAATENSSQISFYLDLNPNLQNANYNFSITFSAALVDTDFVSVRIVQVPTPTLGTTSYDSWADNGVLA